MTGRKWLVRRPSPAVEVQKNARPARHDVAMLVRPPASGNDSRRPMAAQLERLAQTQRSRNARDVLRQRPPKTWLGLILGISS